jgi:hypothetical protein
MTLCCVIFQVYNNLAVSVPKGICVRYVANLRFNIAVGFFRSFVAVSPWFLRFHLVLVHLKESQLCFSDYICQ